MDWTYVAIMLTAVATGLAVYRETVSGPRLDVVGARQPGVGGRFVAARSG